jgi:hypothetical protein
MRAGAHCNTRAGKYVGQRAETRENEARRVQLSHMQHPLLQARALSPQIGRLLPIFGCF